MSFDNWMEGLTDVCSDFQVDLSSMVDGELDGKAEATAMLHLEECSSCSEFLEDTRRQARLHRDMTDPSRLMARIAMLTGSELSNEAQSIELIHRLSTIFYKLGKAYTLAGLDIDSFRERFFEQAVQVEFTKTRGRGFVDGVLQSGQSQDSRVDWEHARHLLNGRLERIEDPLEKGHRLLNEAIAIDPSHEEARLYLAYTDRHQGRALRAAKGFRDVFDTALSEENRGHAAVQLGLLYAAEEDYRQAIKFFRWVTITGLADRDDRFWCARFNLGMDYAKLRNQERSLAYLRVLLDRHPDRTHEVAQAFAGSPELRDTIDSQPGFAEALVRQCPELFQADSTQADSSTQA